MRKSIFIILLICLGFVKGFSQGVFPEKPKKYKKINFIYIQKSNYDLREEGVYADTLLLKYEFPNLKYKKVEDPLNKGRICGLVQYSEFYIVEDRKRFIRQVFENNQILNATYYVKKKKTVINVVRDNNQVRELIKKHFKDYSLLKYEYSLEIKGKKNKVKEIIPTVKKDKKYKLQRHEILFVNDANIAGVFRENLKKSPFKDNVILNKGLDKNIVPEIMFSNNDYGVETISTLFKTYQLVVVSYQTKKKNK